MSDVRNYGRMFHPYYLYPFRLYIDRNTKALIDNRIAEQNVQFDRITVFHDFDSSLIGFHTTEQDLEWLLSNLSYTKDFVIHAVEYIISKLIEQYKLLLQYNVPVVVILFSSVGHSKWHKSLYKEYKEHRRISKGQMLLSKANLMLRDIQDFVSKTFITDLPVRIVDVADFVKALKTVIKDYVSVCANLYLPNHAFLIELNVDADIIPYLILSRKYRQNSLYLLLTTDKDLGQIAGLANKDRNNIWLIRKITRQSNTSVKTIDTDNTQEQQVIVVSDRQASTDSSKSIQSYTLVHTRDNMYVMLLGSESHSYFEKLVNQISDDKLKSAVIRREIYVHPYAIPIYLSIVGDASDNIPNCKTGLGKKILSDILWLIHIVYPEILEETDFIEYVYQLYLRTMFLSDYTLLTKQAKSRVNKLRTGLRKYIASDKIVQFKLLLETFLKHVAGKHSEQVIVEQKQDIRDISKHYQISITEILSLQEYTSAYEQLKQIHITNSQPHLCFVRNMYLTAFELFDRTYSQSLAISVFEKLSKYLKQDYTKAKNSFDMFMQYRTGLRTNIDNLLAQLI